LNEQDKNKNGKEEGAAAGYWTLVIRFLIRVACVRVFYYRGNGNTITTKVSQSKIDYIKTICGMGWIALIITFPCHRIQSPLTRITHDDFVVLLQQPFVKAFFRGVVCKGDALFGGVFVGYGQDYARYIHAIFLHAVRSVAERIIVGCLTDHLKGSFVIILNNQPAF
jgi:hypothetical protein